MKDRFQKAREEWGEDWDSTAVSWSKDRHEWFYSRGFRAGRRALQNEISIMIGILLESGLITKEYALNFLPGGIDE